MTCVRRGAGVGLSGTGACVRGHGVRCRGPWHGQLRADCAAGTAAVVCGGTMPLHDAGHRHWSTIAAAGLATAAAGG
jgi:hypothetical protein